jgi:hypothetical protein
VIGRVRDVMEVGESVQLGVCSILTSRVAIRLTNAHQTTHDHPDAVALKSHSDSIRHTPGRHQRHIGSGRSTVVFRRHLDAATVTVA